MYRHDISDSVHALTMLSASAPQQYGAFPPAGVDIVSSFRIRLAAQSNVQQAANDIGLTARALVISAAPVIELDGAITQSEGPNGGAASSMAGPLSVQQDVTAAGRSVHGTGTAIRRADLAVLDQPL